MKEEGFRFLLFAEVRTAESPLFMGSIKSVLPFKSN